MLIGERAGEAYRDDEGRYVYETRDGRTAYRTDRDGFGLWRWSDRRGWVQTHGTTQFRARSVRSFAARMRRLDTTEGAE